MLLEKILQSQGFGSRKYCQQLIKNGSVSIDGEVVSDLKSSSPQKILSFPFLVKIINIEKNLYCSKKTSRF